jgi:hypothetical protein
MRPLLVCLSLLFVACASPEPGPVGFRAGFGRADVTPAIPEPWTDANGDGRYSAEDGDTFEDRDGDGAFDALWLAGSFEGRPAASVADSLTATTLVVDDGTRRIALVSIDNFGILLDDVEDIRAAVPDEWGIGRVLVVASGTHSAPDLVGYWTPADADRTAADSYLADLKVRIVASIGEAVQALEPATMQLAAIDDSTVSPVADVRPPYVYDSGIRLIRFVDGGGSPMGIVVGWTCTPELMGADNLALSSDYVGPFRRSFENSGFDPPVLYLNGAFGGGLTVPVDSAVTDPQTGERVLAPGLRKATSLGRLIGGVASGQALESIGAPTADTVEIRLFTADLSVPIANREIDRMVRSGRIRRDMTTDSLLTTEMNMLLMGDAWILMLPGEVFPEQVNGGITAVPGSDFEGRPEAPSLRPAMRGRLNLVVSNGADAFGPLVPYVEWDADPPFAGDRSAAPDAERRAVNPLATNLTQRGFIGLMRSVMGYLSQKQVAEGGQDR